MEGWVSMAGVASSACHYYYYYYYYYYYHYYYHYYYNYNYIITISQSCPPPLRLDESRRRAGRPR